MVENKKLIEAIVEGLQEKKAKNIVVVDMSELDGAAFKYFVICEGSSTTQVNTIGESVMKYLRENLQTKPFAYDGFANSQWIVVDYGEILVHVFLPETREFYKLEQLWADAKINQIENKD